MEFGGAIGERTDSGLFSPPLTSAPRPVFSCSGANAQIRT